jgi:FYVE zinc finger
VPNIERFTIPLGMKSASAVTTALPRTRKAIPNSSHYEKSSRKLKYVSTGEPDVGWKEKVETMTKTKKEQRVYPKPWVQGDTKSPLEARLGEVYNARPEVARFQFLVKTGGGLNLFNAMQQACRRYINERLQGDTKACVVQMWKVFSESGGMGCSDSCVVYLTEPYTSPSVADLIEYYVWPRVKGLVEMGFVPMGFFKVGGRPLFGVNFAQASAEVQLACLGTIMTESAGQNMGAVLGKAFAFAVEAFTFLKRRHHCRVCGDIFCSDCCQKLGISQIRRPIAPPGGPESGEVYVCDKCRAEVMRI